MSEHEQLTLFPDEGKERVYEAIARAKEFFVLVPTHAAEPGAFDKHPWTYFWRCERDSIPGFQQTLQQFVEYEAP